MIRAAVAGGTGNAGAELVRLLSGHPGVELTMITSRQSRQRFDRVFPSMAGRVTSSAKSIATSASARSLTSFSQALPHKLPMIGCTTQILKHGRENDRLVSRFSL